jgi:hypothetical protein
MAVIVEPLVDKASLTSLDLSANAMGYKGVKVSNEYSAVQMHLIS